jgi:hypothetical protein
MALLLGCFCGSDLQVRVTTAAVISTLWSYHRAYNYVLIVLLMVPLACQGMRTSSRLIFGGLSLLWAASIATLRLALHGLPSVALGYVRSVAAGLTALLLAEGRAPDDATVTTRTLMIGATRNARSTLPDRSFYRYGSGTCY